MAVCIAAAFAPNLALAQQIPDPAAEPRRQQERNEAQQRQLQGAPREAKPGTASEAKPEPRLPQNEPPCFAIHSIEVREASHAFN